MSNAEEIDNKAADWVLQEGEASWNADREAGREAWLEESLAHRVAYLRLKDAWVRADRLSVLKGHEWKKTSELHVSPRYVEIGVRLAAVLAVAVVIGGAAWWLLPNGDRYQTPIGVRETVNLSDGSVIELNTNTHIHTKVSPNERQVVLDKGEAFFQVVHDTKRPFVVLAGNKKIIDVGTKFSVRLDGQTVRVIVTEGEVKIENLSGAQSPPVVAKMDTQVTAGPDVALVSTASKEEVNSKLGWRTGYLVFDGETLADVVAEFNRYNEHKLILDGAEVGTMKIGGTFKATNVTAFAGLLHDTFGLKVQQTENETKISR